jgi:predicted nucleic acid-binding protein
MSLVIDSSDTLAWIFSDEINQATRRMLDLVTDSGAWVPVIWPLEIDNCLQTAVRHGRIKTSFRDAALADLACMDIKIDTETNNYAWSTTMQLSQQFKHTLYDACYLELARRKNFPLASLDRELRAAAEALGVAIM